jgi:hypothetical protein
MNGSGEVSKTNGCLWQPTSSTQAACQHVPHRDYDDIEVVDQFWVADSGVSLQSDDRHFILHLTFIFFRFTWYIDPCAPLQHTGGAEHWMTAKTKNLKSAPPAFRRPSHKDTVQYDEFAHRTSLDQNRVQALNLLALRLGTQGMSSGQAGPPAPCSEDMFNEAI